MLRLFLVTSITVVSFLLLSCSKEDLPIENIPVKPEPILSIEYSKAVDTSGNFQKLDLDLYLPARKSFTDKAPLFVMIHGGSFLRGTKEWMSENCVIMSDSGFVSVSINYRLGWRQTNACAGDTSNLKQAMYRGMQDAYAAIQFLVKHADEYGIDTSTIFIGGESAGACIALNMACLNPTASEYPFADCMQSLGNIGQNSDQPLFPFAIRGICNKWGAVADTNSETRTFTVPVISFHGTDDPLVPIENGYLLGCKQTPAFGCEAMYKVMMYSQVPLEMYIKTWALHQPTGFDPAYTMSRTAAFFKKVMNGTATQAVYIQK